jgi:hypothetical protein
MTNEQLAALLRPYLLDISDMAQSAGHVIPGNEALLLSALAGRLELLAQILGESVTRLDNPLLVVKEDGQIARLLDTPHCPTCTCNLPANAP